MAEVRANTTFHACGQLVIEGATLDALDPVVYGREHLFDKVDEPKKVQARKVTAKKAAPK